MKFAVSILLLILCGCNNSSDKLVIGTSGDNPPYEYIKDNQVVGIDIDIIKSIAKVLDKEIEIKNMDFSMLIPSLITGHVDLIIAGLNSTEERRKNVDFSDVYFASPNLAILFKKDKNLSMLNIKNKILGAQIGTTWSNIAHNLSNNVRELSSNLVLIEELNIENIDALVLEQSQTLEFVKKYSNLTYFIIDQSSDFVIALAKNSKMTKEINHAIRKLKEEKIIEKIKNEWIKKN
jgi:polar amino acid transport system substrate-binding protein